MTTEAREFLEKWDSSMFGMRTEFANDVLAVIAAERADAAHAAVMAEREMRREVEDG